MAYGDGSEGWWSADWNGIIANHTFFSQDQFIAGCWIHCAYLRPLGALALPRGTPIHVIVPILILICPVGS